MADDPNLYLLETLDESGSADLVVLVVFDVQKTKYYTIVFSETFLKAEARMKKIDIYVYHIVGWNDYPSIARR